MAEDARLSTTLAEHPKIKKLGRRLGTAGQWHWVCLLLWVASNRSDGSLSGMSDEDIELAASWPTDCPAFLPVLRDLALIDGNEFESEIHDWAEHNPWMAGAKARSAKGRWNAAKRHHGEQEADRLVPEYRANKIASSNAATEKTDASSNAPYPYPYPYPLPKEIKPLSSAKPMTQEDETDPGAKEKRLERLKQITDDAVTAFNSSLARPAGLLPSVHATVGREKRRSQVARCLKVARDICSDQYGDSTITLKFWESYFAECALDPFKSGRQRPGKGHENWTPSFEYLTREAVVIEVFDKANSEGIAA